MAGQDHGHKFCLLITHTQFKAAIIVCASDSKAQEMWLKALREATKMFDAFSFIFHLILFLLPCHLKYLKGLEVIRLYYRVEISAEHDWQHYESLIVFRHR